MPCETDQCRFWCMKLCFFLLKHCLCLFHECATTVNSMYLCMQETTNMFLSYYLYMYIYILEYMSPKTLSKGIFKQHCCDIIKCWWSVRHSILSFIFLSEIYFVGLYTPWPTLAMPFMISSCHFPRWSKNLIFKLNDFVNRNVVKRIVINWDHKITVLLTVVQGWLILHWMRIL